MIYSKCINLNNRIFHRIIPNIVNFKKMQLLNLWTDTMMVKSVRTKKFDDEIYLISENRGLESLGYIQVDSIIYILIIVQSL